VDQVAFILCALIILIGALLTWYWNNHYDKLNAISIMAGGVMPLLISTGYLDVAIIVALVSPFATILLTLMIKEQKTEIEQQEKT
jgi:energy-converting hydrogenase Eha subunit C